MQTLLFGEFMVVFPNTGHGKLLFFIRKQIIVVFTQTSRTAVIVEKIRSWFRRGINRTTRNNGSILRVLFGRFSMLLRQFRDSRVVRVEKEIVKRHGGDG